MNTGQVCIFKSITIIVDIVMSMLERFHRLSISWKQGIKRRNCGIQAMEHFNMLDSTLTTCLYYHWQMNWSERFICSAVIGASHACQAVHEEKEQDAVENQGHSLEYDRLAQAARSKGISQLPCKTLSNRIQQRLQLSENQSSVKQELATTCLNESQLKWLWNKTLYYHHYMLPNDNDTTKSDEELKIHFQKASTTTLCQVNVEQVLVDRPELFSEKKKKTQTNGRMPPP